MQSLVASHRYQIGAIAAVNDRLTRQRPTLESKKTSGDLRGFRSYYSYLSRQESNQNIGEKRRDIVDHWKKIADKNLHEPRMDDRIILNVSGLIFETCRDTLRQFPNTLLGDPERLEEFYEADKNQYFLPRNRVAFDGILYFYQSGGTVYRPRNVEVMEFYEEMQFFDLGEHVLQAYVQRENMCLDCVADAPGLPQHSNNKRIKFDMETATAVISMLAIVLWITLMLAETVPSIQQAYGGSAFARLQLGFAIFFTVEFIFYFGLAITRKKDLINFLTLMDLISLPAFYIIVALSFAGRLTDTWYLRFTQFLRILKIFQLGRHIEGMRIYARTFTTSCNDIMMMIFLLILGVVLFSSGAYYTQGSSVRVFSSIPDAFWYSIVTMTTVGYGDIVPKSDMGKFIGAACALTGLLVLALMVPIIAANFEKHYQDVKYMKKHTPCKRLREAAAAKRAKQNATCDMTFRGVVDQTEGISNQGFDSGTEVALEETDIDTVDNSSGVKHGVNVSRSVDDAVKRINVQAEIVNGFVKDLAIDEETDDDLKICSSPRSDIERMDLHLDESEPVWGSFEDESYESTRL